MVEETVNTRLSESSKDGAELDVFLTRSNDAAVGSSSSASPAASAPKTHLNRVEVVLIFTSSRSGSLQDVGDQIPVSDLLIGHEFNQESIGGIDTDGFEFFNRESSESVVEEIEFDEFLVECPVR